MPAFVRAKSSFGSFRRQLNRFFTHFIYLFWKNVNIRWKRSAFSTILTVLLPLQLIFVLWLFQVMGLDSIMTAGTRNNQINLQSTFDAELQHHSSADSIVWPQQQLPPKQQPATASTAAATRVVASAGLYIDETYPINISLQHYGRSCSRLALFIDPSTQGTDDARTGKWSKMDQFVREKLVPKIQNEYMMNIDIITVQMDYITRFREYCGSVRVFLEPASDMDLDWITGRDLGIIIQNRTAWASSQLDSQYSATATALLSVNQTQRFLEPAATLYVQHMMHRVLVELSSNASSQTLKYDFQLRMQEFPVKRGGGSGSSGGIAQAVANIIFPLMYTLYFLMGIFSTLQPSIFVTPIVEKEKKIHSTLQMIGCDMSAYHLSWSAIGIAEGLASTLLATCAIFILRLFLNSDTTLFCVMYALTTISFVPMLQLIGLFFSNVKSASMVFSMLSLVVLVFWYIAKGIQYLLPSLSFLQFVANLFSPFVFLEFVFHVSLAEHQIPVRDAAPVRFGWSTMLRGSFSLDPSYSALAGFFGLLFDIVLYFLILLYAQKVVPQKLGTVDSPYALLTLRFWKDLLFGVEPIGRSFESSSGHEHEHLFSDVPDEDEQLADSATSSALHERDVLAAEMMDQAASGASTGISIQHLFKTFNKGLARGSSAVRAVNDLSLDIPSGQIFALLGANGAGKTTTLHIIGGLLSPTSGSIQVNGFDVSEDMDIIRQNMGICMQEDTVYEKMTGYEHMKLVAVIRNIPKRHRELEIRRKLEEVGLWEHRSKLVTQYSGGMKRRLSFAMAVIGDPQVLILDECTAGTDPMNKHLIWTILQKYKRRPGSVILVTSHSMEEVDLLADTIAVMKRGKLEVVGSSLQLKNHYGIGYHLVCNPKQDQVRTDLEKLRVETQLRRFVEGHFPEIRGAAGAPVSQPSASASASATSSIASDTQIPLEDTSAAAAGAGDEKIRLLLPYAASSRFPRFLHDLEANLSRLHLDSYGLNVTTLEEVFLKINEQEETAQNLVQQAGQGGFSLLNFLQRGGAPSRPQ